MSVRAECEVCHRNRECMRVGKHFVCVRCIGIYNEIRTLVIEALDKEE